MTLQILQDTSPIAAADGAGRRAVNVYDYFTDRYSKILLLQYGSDDPHYVRDDDITKTRVNRPETRDTERKVV